MSGLDQAIIRAPDASLAGPTFADALSTRDSGLPVIALVGRPNVGKSTFLSRASGSFVATANAPGTTIVAERKLVGATRARGRRGLSRAREGGAWLVDLPGTTSLVTTLDGDERFWQMLVNERPDALLVLVDAGDLCRHLPLTLACRDLGLPMVVATNLSDEAAARGLEVDTGRLSQLLAAPVHRTVGRTGQGVGAAVADAILLARRRRAVRSNGASPSGTQPASPYPMVVEAELAAATREIAAHSLGAAAFDEGGLAGLVVAGDVSARGAATLRMGDALESARWDVAERWAKQVEHPAAGRVVPDRPARHSADRLARLATAPWPGIPLFIGVTLLCFAVMMIVGASLSTFLADAWAAMASPVITAAIHALVPWATVANALLWALDGALLAMISVGIPYVLTFYLLLAVLEDSGYLTSAAVLTDRFFNALGLPGRAAIPLLAAAACNVPAIYGTRVLATRRERLIASFLITMTPCSARSAVVIAALAPYAGPIAALGAFGVIAALDTEWRASRESARAGPPASPRARARAAAGTDGSPCRRKGVGAIPGIRPHGGTGHDRRLARPRCALRDRAGGPVARIIEPVVGGWLGLPAVAGLALGFAFLRKELALQLLVALAVMQLGAGAASLGSFMSPGQLFVYAIVTSVSVPCIATLATLAAEFGWRAALTMSGATLVVALGAGGLVARLLSVA